MVILEQPFSPLVSPLSTKNGPENKLYLLLQQTRPHCVKVDVSVLFQMSLWTPTLHLEQLLLLVIGSKMDFKASNWL